MKHHVLVSLRAYWPAVAVVSPANRRTTSLGRIPSRATGRSFMTPLRSWHSTTQHMKLQLAVPENTLHLPSACLGVDLTAIHLCIVPSACLGGDLTAGYLCIERRCLQSLLWDTCMKDVSHLREATINLSLPRQSRSFCEIVVDEQVYCFTDVLAHSIVVLVEYVHRTALENVAPWKSQKCTLQCRQ